MSRSVVCVGATPIKQRINMHGARSKRVSGLLFGPFPYFIQIVLHLFGSLIDFPTLPPVQHATANRDKARGCKEHVRRDKAACVRAFLA
mgnify:CR=1 FL=1